MALGPGMPVFSRAAKALFKLKTSFQPLVKALSADWASLSLSLSNGVFNFSARATSRPTAGHEKPSQKQRWLHSDIKNVALPIIYPTFQMMVSQGLLK